jgi:replicative DNA helicase
MQEISEIAEGLQRTAEQFRVPPHSIEAEQAILGGLLLDNKAWDTVADLVAEEDFYRRDHRLIFKVLHALSDESQPMDVVTVSEALLDTGGAPVVAD